MLDANFYLDARTREKRLRLQGKCQLAELPSAGITWETDDNGFVVAARGKETTATYRYDSEGYPTGKTTVAKNERFTVVSTPAKDPRKAGLHGDQHLQRSSAGQRASNLRLR
jgi:hypothetical protein